MAERTRELEAEMSVRCIAESALQENENRLRLILNTLVDAIITMAQSLGLNVVAEGIETPAQLEQLRRLGVHVGQGYLLCRPCAVQDLPNDFLSQGR